MSEAPPRTIAYTLTAADALAYEQAAARLTPLGVLALVLWLGLWGAAAFFVPRDWAGPRLGWSFPVLVAVLGSIAYVLQLLAIALRQWLAARRRIPRPVEMLVTPGTEGIDIVEAGVPRRLDLRDIRESILGRTHLFLVSDGRVLILPRLAFEDEFAIDELAAHIAGRPPPSRPAPKVDPAPPSA
jgi:hypothetical protein